MQTKAQTLVTETWNMHQTLENKGKIVMETELLVGCFLLWIGSFKH